MTTQQAEFADAVQELDRFLHHAEIIGKSCRPRDKQTPAEPVLENSRPADAIIIIG